MPEKRAVSPSDFLFREKASEPSYLNRDIDNGVYGDVSLFSASLFSLLQRFLSGLPATGGKRAQHEALKSGLAQFGFRLGYRGSTECLVDGGRIDVCWVNSRGAVVAAFEVDYGRPRKNSLRKLRVLGCKDSYVVLRKGGICLLRQRPRFT